MGLYAICLAGSNYVAPVICGFIAQYQGWQWVFYWPSIFLALTLVFLFFLMEETNYHRHWTAVTGPNAHPVPSKGNSDTDLEKATEDPAETAATSPVRTAAGYKKKSYLQKLSLLGPRQQKNYMLRKAGYILYFLTWPAIFYAGYSILHVSGHHPRPTAC